MLGNRAWHGIGGKLVEEMNEQIDIQAKPEKVFTEEEFNRKLTAEVDRRVESGIQKGLETKKQKWQQEFEERAKFTAEELAQKQLEEKTKELSAKEREIAKRGNKIEAKEMLSGADIPKAHYDKFLDVLISDDADVTAQNVKNFIEMFNTTKKEIETRLKTEMSTVRNPKQGESEKPMTKEEFNKLPYSKKVEMKKDNPELWKQFMK